MLRRSWIRVGGGPYSVIVSSVAPDSTAMAFAADHSKNVLTDVWSKGLCECDDVINRAHVSRSREQQATASRGR